MLLQTQHTKGVSSCVMRRGEINYFGKVKFRNDAPYFGIKHDDRFLHQYIIGQTGTGKTTLLETMIKQDIQNGYGLWLLDPHGDLSVRLVNSIPSFRKKDLVYLNIPSHRMTYRYNPLLKVEEEHQPLVASTILQILKKLWKGAWGYRIEHILRYTFLTLLQQQNSSFADVPILLTDEDYRKECLGNVHNAVIQRFWKHEYNRYSKHDITPILNKFGAFLVHPALQRFLIGNKNDIHPRTLMDSNKIVLVNLSKGTLGEDISHIIGSLLVTSLATSAFSRADIKEEKRLPCFLYMDEFQNFTNLTLVSMLSELRKYKLGMIMAHQYIAQLDSGISSAIVGNVGTITSFRLGTHDARFIESIMYPEITTEDLIRLPNRHIYTKLLIDGKPSRPFSGMSVKYDEVKRLTNNLWRV